MVKAGTFEGEGAPSSSWSSSCVMSHVMSTSAILAGTTASGRGLDLVAVLMVWPHSIELSTSTSPSASPTPRTAQSSHFALKSHRYSFMVVTTLLLKKVRLNRPRDRTSCWNLLGSSTSGRVVMGAAGRGR